MKVSIIIPSYKPKAYLWECLDSVCNQALPKADYEVILVLNGCREPWKSQIDEYVVKCPSELNFTFLHTDTPGVSNARNIALDIARGEYITFIDDDDYVSPMFLEELLNKASRDTVALCYPYSFNDGTKTQIPYSYTSEYERYARFGRQNAFRLRKYYMGSCLKLIPIDIIGTRRFDVNFRNGEDSLFMFLVSDRFKYVDFTSKEAVYYRRVRQDSAFFSKKPLTQRLSNSCKWIIQLCRYYFKHPRNYNFLFFCTRILGSIKGAFC